MQNRWASKSSPGDRPSQACEVPAKQ
jgi:hypothetical protein